MCGAPGSSILSRSARSIGVDRLDKRSLPMSVNRPSGVRRVWTGFALAAKLDSSLIKLMFMMNLFVIFNNATRQGETPVLGACPALKCWSQYHGDRSGASPGSQNQRGRYDAE